MGQKYIDHDPERHFPGWPYQPDPKIWNEKRTFTHTFGCMICKSRKRGLIEDLITSEYLLDKDIVNWLNHHDVLGKTASLVTIRNHRRAHMGVRKQAKVPTVVGAKKRNQALAEVRELGVKGYLELVVQRAGVPLLTGEYTPTVSEGNAAANILIKAPKEIAQAQMWNEALKKMKASELQRLEDKAIADKTG